MKNTLGDSELLMDSQMDEDDDSSKKSGYQVYFSRNSFNNPSTNTGQRAMRQLHSETQFQWSNGRSAHSFHSGGSNKENVGDYQEFNPLVDESDGDLGNFQLSKSIYAGQQQLAKISAQHPTTIPPISTFGFNRTNLLHNQSHFQPVAHTQTSFYASNGAFITALPPQQVSSGANWQTNCFVGNNNGGNLMGNSTITSQHHSVNQGLINLPVNVKTEPEENGARNGVVGGGFKTFDLNDDYWLDFTQLEYL